MRVKIHKGYWTPNDVQQDSEFIYIFGDNDIKKGKKGQAIIRDLDNAFGIPTKKYPAYHKNAYYYDDTIEDNCKKIDIAIQKIKDELDTGKYSGIILPEDGLGTGLSKLPQKAPETYKYLCEEINNLKIYVEKN